MFKLVRLGASTASKTRVSGLVSATRFYSKEIKNELKHQESSESGDLVDLNAFKQAPNHPTPRPLAAIDLIAKQPVRIVNGRKAYCDGEVSGSSGHPRVYINLDNPNSPATCLYCGLRFQQAHDHGHH
ncbi:NADH dehydrogenase [ubiquinone] iron-sulfur protein 6, mitochondrial [Smittium culicis]|uniref:NADH dehydrogenase [ubiquinone] iron-sulfur protein 6, mitochondrial n=1 Tax=Smittium culicis TaxID=133412 RepID=A0A1R1Y637_9FUNG|nr:NADH dehydrogenase [ubiquinone] iron-sulfur protein 6, mitochondrial [Smittium culicis]